MSQTGKILKMLREAGNKGIANYQFPLMGCLRYSARIGELRADGHNVYCERQYVNGRATGVFKYFLIEEDMTLDEFEQSITNDDIKEVLEVAR